MASDRVFYPVKDVTLRGLLSEAMSHLHGYSDVWAFRERLLIHSGFALAASLIIGNAIKELDFKGGLTLESSDVEIICGKSVSNLSADVILSVLISTAARKTVELQEQIGIRGTVRESVQKWLAWIGSGMAASGNISDSSIQSVLPCFVSGICLVCDLQTPSKKLEARCEALLIGLSEDIGLSKESRVFLTGGSAAISGSMKAVIRRYRIFLDAQDLKFSDVSTWDMNTFYYLEV